MFKFKRLKLKWIILIIILVIIGVAYVVNFTPKKVKWGVTFSKQYAQNELGLDWKKTYLAILDDLKIDHLRLSAYWNETEPSIGSYDFKDLDWQINEASKRNVKIVLAVGRRLPRWPECHDPSWVKDMGVSDIKSSQLKYIEKVMQRYSSNPNIIYWQIENEPYLKYFGECPALDRDFFRQEIILAKTLTDKPILVTDSGELGLWLPVASAGGDILGTTLYKVVYNKTLGYFEWFLPPSFYFTKTIFVKWFTPTEKVIVAELQAEAWHRAGENLNMMTLDDSFESMDLKQFKENIKFAQKSGFDEAYLWGVEWWYLAKTQKGYDGYWNEAKKLWQ